MRALNGLVNLCGPVAILVMMLAGNVLAFSDPASREVHKNCSGLSQPGHYPDYDSLPAYSIHQRRYSATQPKILEFNAAVSPDAATSETALTRLGCKFLKEFAEENAVEVLIFDNKDAADKLKFLFSDESHYYVYLWHVKGRYVMDKAKRVRFVEFVLPIVSGGFVTFVKTRVWLE